jgi:phospholipid/cholesterol/gamma-HCH transport system substrate-binding protein
MERRANYAAVGAFVLLAIGLAGAFVYWYSEGRDARNYQRYEIYFPGSVTGLSEGSSVRYLGVEVGKIRRIRVDPRSPERVQVIVDIDQSAPISDDTAASLSILSLATGLLYIDLLRIGPNSTVLPAVPSERYPVIASMRSRSMPSSMRCRNSRAPSPSCSTAPRRCSLPRMRRPCPR